MIDTETALAQMGTAMYSLQRQVTQLESTDSLLREDVCKATERTDSIQSAMERASGKLTR